jgi:hypothetical protein
MMKAFAIKGPDGDIWAAYTGFDENDAMQLFQRTYPEDSSEITVVPVTISERGEQDAGEDTCDSVRGILQILRGKPGCTFADVRKHCEMRGDDMEWWPAWIDLQEGYVTEHGAAKMIYDVMSAHLSRKEPK